jgi:hypothetical protein
MNSGQHQLCFIRDRMRPTLPFVEIAVPNQSGHRKIGQFPGDKTRQNGHNPLNPFAISQGIVVRDRLTILLRLLLLIGGSSC